MSKLDEIAATIERIGRLHVTLSNQIRAASITEEDIVELSVREETVRIPAEVAEVWEKYCEARAEYYRSKHRLSETHAVVPPALTPQRVNLIRGAISRHGVERVKRAAIGMFLSEFHIGKNEHGKEYLEPERPFQIKNGRDMVDFFAEIYAATHREF